MQGAGSRGQGLALRMLCAGLGELTGLTRCVDICYTLFASGRGLPQKIALTKGKGKCRKGGGGGETESRVESTLKSHQISTEHTLNASN